MPAARKPYTLYLGSRGVLLLALNLMLLVYALYSQAGSSESATLNLPLIDLDTDPLLHPGRARDDSLTPTLTLAVGVDTHSLQAAYSAVPGPLSGPAGTTHELQQAGERQSDSSYSSHDNQHYLGYFAPQTCYRYLPAQAYFEPQGPTTAQHSCNGQGFSGHFLNWATTTRLDILRLTLTGGDRYLDQPERTVLQRSVLPAESPTLSSGLPTATSGVLDTHVNNRFVMKRLTATQVAHSLPKLALEVGTQDIYILNCQEKMLVSKVPMDSCGRLPDPTDYQAYSVRVAVCTDPSEMAQRSSLLGSACTQYPSSHYKPTGLLQRYADRLRIAVLAPPLQQSAANSILQSPMHRLIGSPKTIAGTRSLVDEWDAKTGVLHALSNSTMTYLNQLGRHGSYPPVPLSDQLYASSLQYLQGLTPARPVSPPDGPLQPALGADSDPFPIDPDTTDYSCLCNALLLIGATAHSTQQSRSVHTADFGYWANIVQSFETGQAQFYLDGSGNKQSTANPPNPLPIRQAASGLADSAMLAGLAYWSHTHDIRPLVTYPNSAAQHGRKGLRVLTYVLDWAPPNQPAFYTANGLLAAKYGGFEDFQPEQGNPFVEPQPLGRIAASHASWQRIGQAGIPRHYLSAYDPAELVHDLEQLFVNLVHGSAWHTTPITSITTWPALNQNQANEAELNAAWYKTYNAIQDNYGDILSYAQNSFLSNQKVVFSQLRPQWSAATLLNQRAPESRRIVVGTHTNGRTSALFFSWPEIEKSYATSLSQPSRFVSIQPADTATLASQRVSYLRGDRSHESAQQLRPRVSLLGDTVRSDIILSKTNKSLFVGANDGMLHAFDITSGEERFAYIPSWLVPKLYQLTDPYYRHIAFVDATPTLAEITAKSAKASALPARRMVLVGGTGAGGQGVYALDVTQPDTFSPEQVLWEFTDADDPDLGNVLGRPRILKIALAGQEKWFAVFGSGVNNYQPDAHMSTHGQAAIFLLDITKPKEEPWSLVKGNYYKVLLPLKAGLKQPSGVLNISTQTTVRGLTTQLYAGDLHGQVWQIDLTHSLSSVEPRLIFEATYRGQPQPITSAPAILRAGDQLAMVIATGKWLEKQDQQTDTDGRYPTQSVYGLFLPLAPANQSADKKSRPITRDQLRLATLANPQQQPYTRNDSSAPLTPNQGWYFDLPNSADRGERQISPLLVWPGKILFNSLIPAGRQCHEKQASASYTFSVLTGTYERQQYETSLLTPAVIPLADTSTTGVNTPPVLPSIHTVPWVRQDCTAHTCHTTQLVDARRHGRLSWRVISNYAKLQQQARP